LRAERLLDTSAAVPLTVAGHEAHGRTFDALRDAELGLAGHAWFETFSVLTRLPPPARRPSAQVLELMRHNFPRSVLLSAEAARTLQDRIVELRIAGGAVYDALVGAAAVEHGVPLVSRDARAVALYRLLGADVELLA
jgi:predicted nucleic acid-binding protein